MASRSLRASQPSAVRSGFHLAVNSGATAGLGFLYWIAAARLFTPAEVGIASATVAAVTFLSSLGQLNLYASLTVFMPTSGQAAKSLMTRIYVLTAATSAAAGLIYVVGAHLTNWWKVPISGPLASWCIVLAICGWTVFALQDSALLALGRSGIIAIENAFFGVGKIALLVALAALPGVEAILLSWSLPLVLCVVAINTFCLAPLLRDRSDQRYPMSSLRGFATIDFVAAAVSQAASSTLPLIVLQVRGAREAGYFAVVWSLVSAVDVGVASVANTISVSGTTDRQSLIRGLRTVGIGVVTLTALGVVAMVASSRFVLNIFGGSYTQVTGILQFLLAASIPRAFVVCCVAAFRSEKHPGYGLITYISSAIVVLGLGIPYIRSEGLPGLARAWIVGQIVAGGVAALLLWRLLSKPRRRHTWVQYDSVGVVQNDLV